MSCQCISKLDKALKKEGLSLHTAFTMSAEVYPAIYAHSDEVFKSGKPKKEKLIVPNFCFLCGKRYKKEKK